MTLRFKNEAEFARWRKTLPERPRLRVAASMGERVVVDGPEVTVPPSPVRRGRIPGRQDARRWLAHAFLAVMLAGLQGMMLCEAALWGLSQACR